MDSSASSSYPVDAVFGSSEDVRDAINWCELWHFLSYLCELLWILRSAAWSRHCEYSHVRRRLPTSTHFMWRKDKHRKN